MDVRAITTNALEIRGLYKTFDKPAVAGLDLTVKTGEFYGLLGPNGAGKTTTLRMVAGLLLPDAGTITIAGRDALKNPVEAKRVVAWISDEPMIYDKLTPLEYLEFVAGLWGIDAGDAVTDREHLADLGHFGFLAEVLDLLLEDGGNFGGADIHYWVPFMAALS